MSGLFWSKVTLEQLEKIKTFVILPFNEERAMDFFLKKYPENTRRAAHCIELAKKFTRPKAESQYEFIPFILEVVDNQLEIKADSIISDEYQDDKLFFSDILKPSNFSDYVFYKICYRETIRQGYSNVDEQIKLFIQLTLDNPESENAKTTKGKFEATYNLAYGGASNVSHESILSHPILFVSDECISFKYDFFKDYFKSLIISNLLEKSHSESPLNYIDILISHTRYDSNFTQEVTTRFEKLSDNLIYNIIVLIAAIRKLKLDVVSIEKKCMAISSLFVTTLKIHYKGERPNIETNTNIMKELFGKDELQGLCLNNITTSNEDNQILLDFTDLTITESYIYNYSHFLKCKVSDNTLFLYSTITNIPLVKYRETQFRTKHFDQGNKIDFQLTDFLKEIEYVGKDIGLLVTKDLKNLFSILRPNNQFEKVKIKRRIEPKFHYKIIELNELINHLQTVGIITKTDEGAENSRLYINEKYEREVANYLNNGIFSPELQNFTNRLINIIYS